MKKLGEKELEEDDEQKKALSRIISDDYEEVVVGGSKSRSDDEEYEISAALWSGTYITRIPQFLSLWTVRSISWFVPPLLICCLGQRGQTSSMPQDS
ncbi:hypothetical protein MKW98_015453 [Papaver atlanticum]|uniref:Uncharacterized protein n=1 Tax=Papaver atlanticum TaxID=357466 RepID=A0AAD4S0J8_9MAGN|nr:hypothetical protein MKW98_015453 [Papaver atlanticum]